MRMNDIPDWQKLVKLVGDEAAAAVSALYGGGRIYVPRFLGAHHPITQCVGSAGAARLVAEFGGGHIDVPISLGKRARVMQLTEAGVPVPEICRTVGVSRRTVFYVREAARSDDDAPQPDLFATPPK